MPLKEVDGQPGLFRDTLDNKIYNIRDLPMTDPRLGLEVLCERFAALLEENEGDASKTVEALVEEIKGMEHPEHVKLSPSYLLAIVCHAKMGYLTQVVHEASKEVVGHFGDFFNLFMFGEEEEEEEE